MQAHLLRALHSGMVQSKRRALPCLFFFHSPAQCAERSSGFFVQKTNTCPVDRIEFTAIRIKQIVRTHPVLKLKYVETVPVDGKEMEDAVDMAVSCQICGLSDREETLLLCDDCDNGRPDEPVFLLELVRFG